MGAFQSDSFKGRERLVVFELWDGEVKVWTSRGAGDEAKRSVVGKDTAIEDSSHKVITSKHWSCFWGGRGRAALYSPAVGCGTR